MGTTSTVGLYRKLIEAAASKHGLSPDLIEAQSLVESSGNAHAYRPEPGFWDRYMKGKPAWKDADPLKVAASYGLLQIMYPVAQELGYKGTPEGLFDPATNLEWGCKKLKLLMDWAKGNATQALAAYNGGKGGNYTPPYRNVAYAEKVLNQLQKLQAQRTRA